MQKSANSYKFWFSVFWDERYKKEGSFHLSGRTSGISLTDSKVRDFTRLSFHFTEELWRVDENFNSVENILGVPKHQKRGADLLGRNVND